MTLTQVKTEEYVAKADGLRVGLQVSRGSFELKAQITAAPGEVIAIMGPSGAGKSTLLRAISGGLPGVRNDSSPGECPVLLDGQEPGAGDILILDQDPLLFPHMTALQNVIFALRVRGIDRKAARLRAVEWLAKVGLSGLEMRYPDQLSQGQQQRVALARALAGGPRLLLLDEPLTSLDPVTAAEVRAVISQLLAASQTTALIVTHNLVDAAALAQRLIVIEHGQVTQDAALALALEQPATEFVASLAGLNCLEGRVEAGMWRHPASGKKWELLGEEAGMLEGECALLCSPGDVRLARPGEGQAGEGEVTWATQVVRLEPGLGAVRVHTADPQFACDLPVATAAGLGLQAGQTVQLTMSRRQVRFLPR